MDRNNYRKTPACANCKHVFRRQEIDEPDAWYCTFGAPMRPSCDSREEMPEATWELLNAWHDWAKTNEVCAWGVCDRYEAGQVMTRSYFDTPERKKWCEEVSPKNIRVLAWLKRMYEKGKTLKSS